MAGHAAGHQVEAGLATTMRRISPRRTLTRLESVSSPMRMAQSMPLVDQVPQGDPTG